MHGEEKKKSGCAIVFVLLIPKLYSDRKSIAPEIQCRLSNLQYAQYGSDNAAVLSPFKPAASTGIIVVYQKP